jgi:hypothetical protein
MSRIVIVILIYYHLKPIDSICGSLLGNIARTVHKKKKTPWPETTSELYWPSDRRLLEKSVPTFADRCRHVVSVTDSYGRIFGFLTGTWPGLRRKISWKSETAVSGLGCKWAVAVRVWGFSIVSSSYITMTNCMGLSLSWDATSCSHIQKLPKNLIELKGSLQCSQEHTTGLKISINYYLLTYV